MARYEHLPIYKAALDLTTYNHHIPQRALNHQTPIHALQK